MNFKRFIATAAMIAMTASTAYAGPATIAGSAPKAEETVEEAPVRVVTYAEAVERAIKNNSDLKALETSLETLEDTRKDLGDALNYQVANPNPMGTTYLDPVSATLLTSLNSVEINLKNIKYSRQMLEDTCELMVKNYMMAIVSAEDNVEMLRETLEMSNKTNYFNRLKYNMGMISDTEINEAVNTHKQNQYNLQLVEMNLDAAYNNFGNLIGIRNEKFVIDYNVEFEAYPEQQDVTAFANRIVSTDPSLKVAEGNVNDAQFKYDFTALENGASFDERNNNLEAAGREYNDTRYNLVLATKNGYISVKQAELNIENLKMTLENTQKQYENAVLSHSLGYITDTELQGAGLALTKAKADLKSAVLSHDLAKFVLERPYMNTAQM